LRSLCATLLVAFVLGAPTTRAMEVVALETRVADGAYHVMVEALLDAPAGRVAQVLTEYASYASLDPRVRVSEVIGSTAAGEQLVRTSIRACAAFFCRHVNRVERVRVLRDHVEAEVLPERSDMRSGWSRTDWSDEAGRTRIRYTAEFEPDFWVPSIVARTYAATAMRESVVQLFRNVEDRARAR